MTVEEQLRKRLITEQFSAHYDKLSVIPQLGDADFFKGYMRDYMENKYGFLLDEEFNLVLRD